MKYNGHCWHCGHREAPVESDGFIDRHRRADHRLNVDPGNELCATSRFSWLRSGQQCKHPLPDPNCRAGTAAPR